mmetsp:Transcript_161243/g.517665  ORF Transcript_161243/g.517665 Transcript_161243/m.517665 type:complete len:206 (-) Transcript_161243:449-1066(-)
MDRLDDPHSFLHGLWPSGLLEPILIYHGAGLRGGLRGCICSEFISYGAANARRDGCLYDAERQTFCWQLHLQRFVRLRDGLDRRRREPPQAGLRLLELPSAGRGLPSHRRLRFRWRLPQLHCPWGRGRLENLQLWQGPLRGLGRGRRRCLAYLWRDSVRRRVQLRDRPRREAVQQCVPLRSGWHHAALSLLRAHPMARQRGVLPF